MPGRATNNSVSTLEEQSLLIAAMSASASGSTKSSASGTEEKKKARKVKSSTSSAKSAGQTTSSTVKEKGGKNGDIVVPVDRGEAEEGDNVSVQAAEAEVGQEQPGVPRGNGLVTLPDVMNFQIPFYGPQQPYFGNMAQYAGFGHPFGPQGLIPQVQPQEEDDWEGVHPVRQGAHQISDDEDDSDGISVLSGSTEPPKLAQPQLDFDSLKTGKLASLLKSQHNKVNEADRVSPEINDTLAKIINSYFVSTKAGDLEKLVKEYPRVKNINRLAVPKLDAELFSAIDQTSRTTDVALQALQKGVVAALSAMAPVASLMLERGETDDELDLLSQNLMDAIQLLAQVTNGLSVRRRELIKPSIQSTYAKALAKGPSGAPEWLFGGNLSEAAHKCEVAKKVAEKLVKRKGGQQTQSGPQQNRQAYRGQNQNKRYRQNGQVWNNQQQQFFQPKTFGYQAFPQSFQAPQNWYQQPYQQYRQKGPRQQNHQAYAGAAQQQDFRLRGPKK